mgnify:FL=1
MLFSLKNLIQSDGIISELHYSKLLTDVDTLIQRGLENIKNENFEKALAFFEQALLLKPDDPDLWNHKGIVLRSMGRYDEAADCYNKSLQLDPRDRASS